MPRPPTRSIARSAVIVMIGMVLSNLAGLLQKMLVANAFGTGSELDAFFTANRLPETLFNLMAGGALASAFIPTYTGFLAKENRAGADRLASAIGSWLVLALGAGSLLCAVFADPLVQHIIAPGYADPSQRELTVALLRILLICPTVFSLSGLVMGILNAHHRFFFAALAPMFYPLGMVFGVLVLSPALGIFGLAWGAVLGACLHLLCQLPSLLRLSLEIRPSLGLANPAVREVLQLMAPRLIGQAAVQLNFLVNTILASGLSTGSLSALTWAWSLMMMPEIAIAQASAVAALPTFSAQASLGELERLRDSLARVTRMVFFLAVPASAGLVILGLPIVRLLFERGSFDLQSAEMVAWALSLYAIGLVSHSVLEVLSRGFYALRDTVTPVVFGTAGMGLNILFSLLLIRIFPLFGWMPYGGLALATTLASFLETTAMVYLLRRRLAGFGGGVFASSLLRTTLATIIMTAFLMLWMQGNGLASVWLSGLGGVAAGAVVYIAAAFVLQSPETHDIAALIARKMKFLFRSS